jgi:hypothetical protein
VAGDFNLIVDAADKNNANLNRCMMGKFRRLLSELDLKEIISMSVDTRGLMSRSE